MQYLSSIIMEHYTPLKQSPYMCTLLPPAKTSCRVVYESTISTIMAKQFQVTFIVTVTQYNFVWVHDE